MTDWCDDTPWRQGHLLPKEVAAEISGSQSSDTAPVGIVISHDCDIAQSEIVEPNVEVIIGLPIDKIDGALANAKSTRTLHLSASAGMEQINLSLDATKKIVVPKSNLVSHVPDEEHKLSPEERNVLQRWLARRYRRAAFPTQFNIRLKKGKADRKIAEKLKPHGNAIRAIYFDVDEGLGLEKTNPSDLYKLGITIVYDGRDGAKSEQIANQVKISIEGIIKSVFYDEVKLEWAEIELSYCDIISDHSITMAQAGLMREWNLDHISLKDQNNQPLVGE